MSFIHSTAEVSADATIGEGTKVWHHSQVMPGATVGENCVIGHNCLVSGKAVLGNGVKIQSNTDVWDLVTLEDAVFVGPSVVFTNDLTPRAAFPKRDFPQYGSWKPTLVKHGASIGANATILCDLTIGMYAMVGAGSVVTSDVPDYALVVGVPAKQIGWSCVCGQRLVEDGSDWRCDCGKMYRLDGKNLRLEIGD